ncbi:CBS domain-containing protein [Cochleicola gelatinilyticus]|uniref:Acetoin utilization protein acuB n=1 Tax=Cochleicola gelatinilyticus TaxID=1763537 RepID=A0A167KCF2_9FLAO|nr:CBS domain-containing protein [Cochleicola gelatinilyticus]OAB81723.1 acetoin utilization protein acuB [Cochleicola gelatinilyticus]
MLQYIINDIDPFSLRTPIKEVQKAFNQLTYSHIPVHKETVFMGSISETDALCFESEQLLEDVQYSLEPFFVRKNTNWLDILEAFALHNSNIMPVLDEKNNYIGYYELGDIMNLFKETPFLSEAGGIIIVEKGMHDYSFSEVCQIVETNDAKMLGAFISKVENDVVEITVKVSSTGMNSIMQTFRRYNYNIVSKHDEDKFLEDLKERSDYLDKYLNI